MPRSKTSSNPLFKRPYPSRRKRDAAKQSPKSSANKILLRALAVLVVMLLVALALIFRDMGSIGTKSGYPDASQTGQH
jgi:flagellar basal body-associated protein FliL